jgi:hypothetical protein
MQPAIKKSPVDYLFALAVSGFVAGGAFAVKPAATKWIVFGVGVFMVLTVLIAAARPIRD